MIRETLKSWLTALKKDAELGNPDAMIILAYMYETGIGVEKDAAASQRYYEMEETAPAFDEETDDSHLFLDSGE